MIQTMFQNVMDMHPLVHNITNYVTVNDCANMLLACKASPIMADDPDDAAEITRICQALNINIGTLNAATIPAMFGAGRIAGELDHPIVLDPVGAGASALRTSTASRLLDTLPVSLVRGNLSEIKALAGEAGKTRGVDAAASDQITKENLDEMAAFAKSFAKKAGCVVAITGAIDLVSDDKTAWCIFNGHPKMSSITGTGCMLSALCAAFLGANPEHPLEAAAAAIGAMGLCGEKGVSRMGELDGNASLRTYILDAMDNLSPEELKEGMRYEIR